MGVNDDVYHYVGLDDLIVFAGTKKFKVSFDDGDEIWTVLPAKDVRPAISDFATAGRIATEGVRVYVRSVSGSGTQVTSEGVLMQDGQRLYISYGKKVVSLRTFCESVGDIDGEPKDAIMIADKDVTLADYFDSLEIAMPDISTSVPTSGKNADNCGLQSTNGLDAHDGMDQDQKNGDSFEPVRKRNTQGFGKYSPNKFMGGVTKKATHIKPYLEAYNRYTTAERRRLRGDPNQPAMTDREAFALAVAKWRKLSDQEKEEWRVKPRKGSKTKARSIRATASVDVGDLEMQISSGDEPMGRDEEASGEAGDSGSNEEDSDGLGGDPLLFDEMLGEEGVESSMLVGSRVLVQDCTDLEWYKGRVIETVTGQIKVHFVGWSSIWDEWIETDSPRLKKWDGARVRPKDGAAEEQPLIESTRTKESWMCTADMRGFDRGIASNGQRVRVRDREFGLLHGAIEDYDSLHGYLVRIEERKEHRWMTLPDPDVDFAQRVNSGITAASQVKIPGETMTLRAAEGGGVTRTNYYCKKCDRYFSSKSALHIHIGKSLECKRELWGPEGKLALHKQQKVVAATVQTQDVKEDDGPKGFARDAAACTQRYATHGASRGNSSGVVIRSFGDIGTIHGVPGHTAASAMIAEILGHPQDALEMARKIRGNMYFTPSQESTITSSRETVMERHQGKRKFGNTATGPDAGWCSRDDPEPLRGTRAKQALRLFFACRGEIPTGQKVATTIR